PGTRFDCRICGRCTATQTRIHQVVQDEPAHSRPVLNVGSPICPTVVRDSLPRIQSFRVPYGHRLRSVRGRAVAADRALAAIDSQRGVEQLADESRLGSPSTRVDRTASRNHVGAECARVPHRDACWRGPARRQLSAGGRTAIVTVGRHLVKGAEVDTGRESAAEGTRAAIVRFDTRIETMTNPTRIAALGSLAALLAVGPGTAQERTPPGAVGR